MSSVYCPCVCGSDKKFKFCCLPTIKKGEMIPYTSGCSKFPIYQCKVSVDWESTGLAPVVVIREMGHGSYALISYLVDFYCLGVKDTDIKIGINKLALNDIYPRFHLTDISYEDARSMILGAVDFAKNIDRNPHSSWFGIPSSFIEANEPYQQKFTFGKDGVPLYISGPYDEEYCDTATLLEKVCSNSGDFIVNIFPA